MDHVHKSSKKGNWKTPKDLVKDLATVFKWNLDVCASEPNVCANFYSPEDDGLTRPWHGLCWMNSPYGRKRLIDAWMRKARIQGMKPGTTVVCLPPARTSTRWWQDNVLAASLVVFIKGRLRFEDLDGASGPAPFPSAFVVFGKLSQAQWDKLCSYGLGMVNILEDLEDESETT